MAVCCILLLAKCICGPARDVTALKAVMENCPVNLEHNADFLAMLAAPRGDPALIVLLQEGAAVRFRLQHACLRRACMSSPAAPAALFTPVHEMIFGLLLLQGKGTLLCSAIVRGNAGAVEVLMLTCKSAPLPPPRCGRAPCGVAGSDCIIAHAGSRM
jgi:hypothetical protein